MIRYRKTGGFAGIEEQLQIEEDGRVQFRSSISGKPRFDVKGRLDRRKLRRITDLADTAQAVEPEKEREGEVPAFDSFHYELTFRRGDREQTLTGEGVTEVPGSLRAFVEALDKIVIDLLHDQSE